MPARYLVRNTTAPTTAAWVKQPTGTAIRTMTQLRPAIGAALSMKAFGYSYSGFAAAAPGQLELFETSVAATMSTAFAVGDIHKQTIAGAAQTAGAGGDPFNLSTTTSGFATAAVTEGTVAGYRDFWGGLSAPTESFAWAWALGDEPEMTDQMYTRFRVTFAASVDMTCWVVVVR
jgi:hypothetical protein